MRGAAAAAAASAELGFDGLAAVAGPLLTTGVGLLAVLAGKLVKRRKFRSEGILVMIRIRNEVW